MTMKMRKINSRNYTAFMQGWNTFQDGEAVNDNPYMVDIGPVPADWPMLPIPGYSDKFLAWQGGFCAASSVAELEKRSAENRD
jgi:hypothetical protein